MHNCIGAEFRRQDARLNLVYSNLLKRLPKPRQDLLRAAELHWIAFRDANCAFYDDADGGTAATLAAASCGLRMTAERADELDRPFP